MGVRKIMVQSDYGDGDIVGPTRPCAANDIVVNGVGNAIAPKTFAKIYWSSPGGSELCS